MKPDHALPPTWWAFPPSGNPALRAVFLCGQFCELMFYRQVVNGSYPSPVSTRTEKGLQGER